MNHFQVTTPDGRTHKRNSLNTYTHAVVHNYGERWEVLRWSSSQALARQLAYQYHRTYPAGSLQVVVVETVTV